MAIGENIRRFRREGGYTQKQLAVIIGVKATYISALERGLRRPGKKILPRLCDALAVDEMMLLYGPRVVMKPDGYIPLDAIAGLSKKQIIKVLNFIKKILAAGQQCPVRKLR
jgi:DNA-binding XRE family transcriptional regulator